MKSKITLSLAGVVAITLLCIVACTELTPVVDEMLYTAAVDAYEKQNSSKKDNTDTDNSTNSDSSDSDSSDSNSNSNSGSTDSDSSDSDSSDSNSNSNSGSTDSDSSDSDSSDSNSNSNSGSTDSNSSGSGSSSSGSNVTTDSDSDDAGYDSSITFTSDADDYDGEISTATGTEEGYEYVDLGLTSGLKWARMNIGAESPEERGSYYAWGELVTKDEYSDDNCANCGLEIDDIIGNPEYDAAAALWGGHWRMPDTDEFQELIDECDWDWVKYNDVTGYVITGPNGSSIFMPTTGYIYLSTLYYESSKGLYWSAIADTADTDMAYHLYFYSTKYDYNSFWNYRRNGRTIRAIYDEDFEYEEEVSYTVSDATGTDDNGYEYVDLGLSSGLKWARVNIGASSPEDYGNYYAWGETETKETYNEYNSLLYYVEVSEISGNILFDAATANMGGHWRMPKRKEYLELINECTWTWATINSIEGYIITGANGNSIFLPASRYGAPNSSSNIGNYYWTSTLYDSSSYYNATPLYFYESAYFMSGGVFRYSGYTIRAIYDEDFEYEDASDVEESYSITDATGTDDSGFEYVDLGLTSGLKWARKNLGASEPEDYGDYYAWGETQTKETYLSSNSATYLTTSMVHFSGDAEYDAATANWGGHWRMPTYDEINELLVECDWFWDSQREGYIVVGSNGNTIFLPAAGYMDGTSLYYTTKVGYYWSSSAYGNYSTMSQNLNFYVNCYYRLFRFARYYGIPIRAVYDEDFECQETVEDDGSYTVSESTGTINDYEYVDLGLTSGLKWARMNIGAESPEERGSYYAWGEIETKETYSTSNSVTYGDTTIVDFSGDEVYDAATANWGSTWRMPTDDECQKIIDECTWIWTTQLNSKGGYIIKGPNGNTIYLPATGFYQSNNWRYTSNGFYWSSSPLSSSSTATTSNCLYFYSSNMYLLGRSRVYGCPVRPVSE